MEEIKQLINDLINGSSISKITLSKPRQKNQSLQNIYIRPILIKDVLYYSETSRYPTEDITKNIKSSELYTSIINYLNDVFFNADISTPIEHINILQSKKGNHHISRKKNHIQEESNLRHDKVKNRVISEERPYLKDLGIVSSNGKVYAHAQKKYKQINKFVEVIDTLIASDDLEKSFSIVDMGCGKGYLTFALFDHLNEETKSAIQMNGIEIRPDLVEKCNAISQKHGMKGLTFNVGNIEDTKLHNVDMVIALHACDIATDMAIAKGISAGAKYIVVAPCCHKQIRKEMKASEVLEPILRHGILMERQAEMVTDGIRSLLLEAHGYKTKAFEFISSEHTGKNLMITAIKSKVNPNALSQIQKIKDLYSIKEHYLEYLLKD